MNSRQYYIDWIRVIAFFILILYHTGMLFCSWGWVIKNDIVVKELDYVMIFFNQWRLPLLFFISGVGVSFALRSRSSLSFFGERSRRLMLPFIIGMFIIVPPQIFFQRLLYGQFKGNFIDFYKTVFELHFFYPYGNLSHLWFLLYLFTYCLIFLPILLWFRSSNGSKFLIKFNYLTARPFIIFLYAIPLILIHFYLFPKFPVNLGYFNDWYNHAFSATIFIFGYILGSQITTWEMLETNRRKFLVTSLILTPFIYIFIWGFGIYSDDSNKIAYLLFSITRILFIWIVILTICGYFKHYLNKSNAFITYSTEAVLPFYILHQTITVAVGYYLVHMNLPVIFKFLIVAVFTFGGSWAIYHYIIKPFNFSRLLFGVRTKTKKIELL